DQVSGERPLLCGSRPYVVIDSFWNGRGACIANAWPPSKNKAACHVHPSDISVPQQSDRFVDGRGAPELYPVLHDTIIHGRGLDHVTAFPNIVGTGFLHIDVLAGLAGPYHGKCVPVVWSRYGNHVDV